MTGKKPTAAKRVAAIQAQAERKHAEKQQVAAKVATTPKAVSSESAKTLDLALVAKRAAKVKAAIVGAVQAVAADATAGVKAVAEKVTLKVRDPAAYKRLCAQLKEARKLI